MLKTCIGQGTMSAPSPLTFQLRHIYENPRSNNLDQNRISPNENFYNFSEESRLGNLSTKQFE